MAAFNIVTWSTAKNSGVRQPSNTTTFDFQAIRVGPSNLQISESSGHFDFDGKRLQNIADGLTSTDVVTLGQMNSAISLAVLTGGSLREAVLIPEQLSVLGIKSATAIYLEDAPVNGDTIVLTDGVSTETYTFSATSGPFTPEIGTSSVSLENLANNINANSLLLDAYYINSDLSSINPNGVLVLLDKEVGSGVTDKQVYGVWGTQSNVKVLDFSAATEYKTSTPSVTLPTVAGSTQFGFQRPFAALENGEIHYVHSIDVLQSWNEDGSNWTTFQNGAIPDGTSAPGGGVKGKLTADENFGLIVTSGSLRISTDGETIDFNSGALAVQVIGSTLSTTGGLSVAAGGITATEISNSALGNYLTGGNGSSISVVVGNGIDETVSSSLTVKAATNTGIEVTSAGVGLKLDGGTLSSSGAGVKVNSAGITETEIASTALGSGLTGGSGTVISVELAGTGGLEFNSGVAVKLDGSSLATSGDGLKIASAGVGTTELSSSVAGNGLTGGNGSALSVVAADSSVSVTSSGVAVEYRVTVANADTDPAIVGEVVAIEPTTGAFVKALASMADLQNYQLGIVAQAIDLESSGLVFLRPGAIIPMTGFVPGPIYVSNLAKGMLTQNTSGLTTGQHVYRVGYIISGNRLVLNPEHLIEL